MVSSQEKLTETLLRASTDPVVLIDGEGRIEVWNGRAREVFGYPCDEVIGRPLDDFLATGGESNGRRLDGVLEGRPCRHVPARFHARDGTAHPVTINGEPLVGEAQGVLGAALVIHDESHRAANRAKMEFLANVTHEFRTPLTNIVAISELLERTDMVHDDERRGKMLGSLRRSGLELLEMVSQAVDVALTSSGRIPVDMGEVECSSLLGRSLEAFGVTAGRRGIELELDLAEDLGTIETDPRRLDELVRAYISNAVKFTPEGGRIVLRARRVDGGSVRIEVEDTGIGISQEDCRRVFDEFLQVDQSVTKGYRGMGLGLAFARRIAETLGGRVGVESELGRGATFWAQLPMHPPGR